MDYDILLNLVCDIGYNLAMSGVETYRVEDSINRILASYNIESEVFSIPNCMTISIRTADNKSITGMSRIGFHCNDLDSVEKFSNLSRKICTEKPDPATAVQWQNETIKSKVCYKFPIYLLENVLGACRICHFFGGILIDSSCAGICAILLGLVDRFLEKFKTNQFFRGCLEKNNT